MTTPSSAPAVPRTAERPVYRVTGARVLRSEWAKLWSLRSTWITLGLALFFLVLLGLIRASTYSPGGPGLMGPGGGNPGSAANAVSIALTGMKFAELALGTLGVLITAGEYSTGLIRATLAAVPRRLPVLWAKSAIFAVVALVVGSAGAFLAFLAGAGPLQGTDVALSLSASGVLRSLAGAGAFLALVGVLGVALGALVRSAAGGISILAASLLLVPLLSELLPESLRDDISPYLPGNAGGSMFALHQAAHALTPQAGLAVFAGWTALALAAAAWRLARTDA
ncbi:ABC transporter permease [Micromonospora sp. SL1-18]|uniref:ABC transporter permease n=1 Tax=Micromonospora sp. SL1-18 TaxID=3399128 RepID=UPI003A4D683F